MNEAAQSHPAERQAPENMTVGSHPASPPNPAPCQKPLLKIKINRKKKWFKLVHQGSQESSTKDAYKKRIQELLQTVARIMSMFKAKESVLMGLNGHIYFIIIHVYPKTLHF